MSVCQMVQKRLPHCSYTRAGTLYIYICLHFFFFAHTYLPTTFHHPCLCDVLHPHVPVNVFSAATILVLLLLLLLLPLLLILLFVVLLLATPLLIVILRTIFFLPLYPVCVPCSPPFATNPGPTLVDHLRYLFYH